MKTNDIQFNISIRLIQLLSNKIPWVSLHDVNDVEFCTRHYHVLAVDVESIITGLFLSLLYYNNVTHSRGESTILARYLHIPNEYIFYCGSSRFYNTLYGNPTIIGELLDADYEDQCNQIKVNHEIK